MSEKDAVRLLAGGLPAGGHEAALSSLARQLGHWPVLLRLANRALRQRVIVQKTALPKAIDAVERDLTHKGVTAFDPAMAAAEKRAPNPILWVKMVLLAIATPMMWKFQMKVFNDPSVNESNIPPSARSIAVWQIALWILIMISGRLIPYSTTILGEGY